MAPTTVGDLSVLKKIALAVSVAVVLASAGPVAAQQHREDNDQDKNSQGLEEIVVTAQRREQRAQDVPIAVSVFSASDIEARQITETLDIMKFVPNAVSSSNTGLGSANTYYIRGIGSTSSLATFDPPVGTYVDDIYMTRQNANNFGFFDVERVEVLRGPQGTLFGRNTTGGAVNVIMRKPGEERSGFTETAYGRDDRLEARGTIDVPLHEKVLTKFSAFYLEDDGFADNQTTGETLNRQKTWGVRGAVRLELTDNILWDIAADYIDDDYMNLVNAERNGSRVLFTGMRTDTPNLQGLVVGQKGDLPLQALTESFSLSSNFEYAFEKVTLNLITGFRAIDQDYSLDFFDGQFADDDPSNNPPLEVINTFNDIPLGFSTGGFAIANLGDYDQFTQEIKLTGELLGGRLRYVTGLFYLDEDNRTDFAEVFTINGGSTAAPVPFPLVLADRIQDAGTEATAVYAQADFDITDNLTFTAGLRWTDEDKYVRYTPNPNPRWATPFNTENIIAAGIPVDQNIKIATPRIALEYRPKDGLMLFASATRGFKSGGWNARGRTANQILPFGPEKVWSFETGFRSDWFDNRFRFNATGFYADNTDLQVPSSFVTSTGGAVFITLNVADLESYGAEFEISALPFNNVDLVTFATLGLQDITYHNLGQTVTDQAATCQANLAALGISASLSAATRCARGIVAPNGAIAEPTRVPDISFVTGVAYTQPFEALDGALVADVNARFVDDHFVDVSNRPESFADSYWSVNASLAFKYRSNWKVSIECRNCFDEVIPASGLAPFVFIDDPANWALRLRYTFNR